jgi:hypothetical protein
MLCPKKNGTKAINNKVSGFGCRVSGADSGQKKACDEFPRYTRGLSLSKVFELKPKGGVSLTLLNLFADTRNLTPET